MAVGKMIYQGVARGESGNGRNGGNDSESVTGFAVSDLHTPSVKRPYELTGYYERTNPETGNREKLGPGEIVMLTPTKAKSMGAIPVKGSEMLHSAADRNLSRGDEE